MLHNRKSSIKNVYDDDVALRGFYGCRRQNVDYSHFTSTHFLCGPGIDHLHRGSVRATTTLISFIDWIANCLPHGGWADRTCTSSTLPNEFIWTPQFFWGTVPQSQRCMLTHHHALRQMLEAFSNSLESGGVFWAFQCLAHLPFEHRQPRHCAISIPGNDVTLSLARARALCIVLHLAPFRSLFYISWIINTRFLSRVTALFFSRHIPHIHV